MKPQVNNDYYNHLGDSWYDSNTDPVAVLRVEQHAKNPWVEKVINDNYTSKNLKIADIGCGAGFFTNFLATRYSSIYGIDASSSTLDVAKSKDSTGKVQYVVGDAYKLPHESGSMDVVCAMDFLEHVDRPEDVVGECARILKPGGLFFFHTFNRNLLSLLIVIKFMEWFVPNTPKNLHVLHLFIKPSELRIMMMIKKLTTQKIVGIGPRFNWYFLKSVLARKVLPGFSFKVGGKTSVGYIGYSKKMC